MKILFVLKTNVGAGWAFREAEWIINNLNGYEFVVVMPNDYEGYAANYKALGCTVIPMDMSLPVRRPWKFFSLRKRIKEIVSQVKPDIIHSHFVTTTWMLRLSLWSDKTQRIFQVPGPLHLESPLFRFVDKWTIRKNDYLVGACEWTFETYKKMRIPQERIFLNYYGGKPKETDNADGRLRKEYHLSQDTPIVGMVSYFYKPKYYLLQFTGLKGHEDFIDAMAIVRKKHPNAKGVVVGAAWGNAVKYENRVKRYAEKKCPDGIIFTGFRIDVPVIYPEFNVAVHPSHSENVGGAGESLGLAVPTVSTNVGGFPDIVVNGVTGWTVAKKSPKQLAEKIIWMIENQEEAHQMALKGQEMCREKFNIDVTGKHMAEIYEIVARG